MTEKKPEQVEFGTQQPKSPKIENIGKNARKISFLTKNLPDSLKVKTTQLC